MGLGGWLGEVYSNMNSCVKIDEQWGDGWGEGVAHEVCRPDAGRLLGVFWLEEGLYVKGVIEVFFYGAGIC